MINLDEMVKVTQCWWCGSTDLKHIADRKDGVGVQECQTCHLLLVAERPEDLAVYYQEEEYFNPDEETTTGYHENYDLISPFYLYWQGALLEEVARLNGARNLLEVGCATGNALEMIAACNSTIATQGIDISPYAVEVCKKKGLNASVSIINNFKSKEKFDIVFSAETMEHVDDLHDFVTAVKKNLSERGIYVFYIPAIRREDIINKGPSHPSLMTSLEHVSYFTEEFLQTQFPKAFDATVFTKFIENSGETYHIGIVSKDKKAVNQLADFINAASVFKPIKHAHTLYNVGVLAAKFGNFELAQRYCELFEKQSSDAQRIAFLKGIVAYGEGHLINAKRYFEESLGSEPPSNLILKIFLSIATETARIFDQEFESKKQQLELQVLEAETELQDLKQSKIVGSSIKLRYIIGKTLDPVRNFKKKIIHKSARAAFLMTPPFLRRPLRYVVRLQWLVRRTLVKNVKIDQNQPLISVVVPYYNAGATISETLQSLKNQSFRNFEIIIVNDGSTEEMSNDKLAEVAKNNPDIAIVRQSNKGVAAARNKAIEGARGKYIVCLDSDDMLDSLYLEKCAAVLETEPNIDFVYSDMRLFGVRNEVYEEAEYNSNDIIHNNMVTTAAMFKRTAWAAVGGYKSKIGYEDWEFWITLAEHGFFGKHIKEPLFNYRTAISSRYISDKSKHSDNMRDISKLHKGYMLKIKKINRYKRFHIKRIAAKTAFVNMDNENEYRPMSQAQKNILIAIPWMTFGGAETLIVNFCREISGKYNLSFVTGHASSHEWQYKFAEISQNIYHLSNMFTDQKLRLEFVANYIQTRNIDTLHIIHNSFMFDMLPELKKRFPELTVLVTMFNDRVEHFDKSLEWWQYVDCFVTDNNKVAAHYTTKLPASSRVAVIPNGIDCYGIFNPDNFNRNAVRQKLGIQKNDIAVFFVGRFASEKNPDVFIKVAEAAFQKAGSRHKKKFFMIGDGPMRTTIEKMIKHSTADIHDLGYQSDVAPFIAAADIFVLPSSIEGFPLSILEAMAMEVCVIASDVGAVSDILQDGKTGFVVPPASVKDFTDRIHELTQDDGVLNSIKRAARKEVEAKYSNKVLGDNYTQLYEGKLK